MTKPNLRSALLLAQEMQARQSDDPLISWQATQKQLPFIASVLGDEFYENWFIAANRSGKSDAGAKAGATLARFGADSGKLSLSSSFKPGSIAQIKDYSTSGWVSALDFPTSRDVIQPKYFDNGFVPPGATHEPFIPEREVERWDKEAQILKLKNGSIVGFKSAEQGRSKFQGTGKDWIHFDEEHPKEIYEEAVIRVEGGRRLRVFTTCTLLPPIGQAGGITWVFPDVIEPWKRGRAIGYQIFGSSIWDNPHIPEEEIERLERMYTPGTTQYRIRLGGELLPGLSGARAYSSFQRNIHMRELGLISQYLPLVWCSDFNVEPMHHVVGQKHGPRFLFFSEIYLDVGTVGDTVEAFRTMYPNHQAGVELYGDATSKSRRSGQTGKSDYQLIMNGMATYPSDVKLCVPEANPFVADRVNAVNYAMAGEAGKVNVLVDPRCVKLVQDFEQVMLDPKGGIKKTSDKKNHNYYLSHGSDAAGYWISNVAPVTAPRGIGKRHVNVPSPRYGMTSRIAR